jgi:hypothetical protein
MTVSKVSIVLHIIIYLNFDSFQNFRCEWSSVFYVYKPKIVKLSFFFLNKLCKFLFILKIVYEQN